MDAIMGRNRPDVRQGAIEVIRRFVQLNKHITIVYICNHCTSTVLFTSITEIEKHMQLLHGQENNGSVTVSVCMQIERP